MGFGGVSLERAPPDPAAGATGIEALVGQSDDYRIYKAAFVEAAQSLISSGRCSGPTLKRWVDG